MKLRYRTKIRLNKLLNYTYTKKAAAVLRPVVLLVNRYRDHRTHQINLVMTTLILYKDKSNAKLSQYHNWLNLNHDHILQTLLPTQTKLYQLKKLRVIAICRQFRAKIHREAGIVGLRTQSQVKKVKLRIHFNLPTNRLLKVSYIRFTICL